jgi:murein DD-endopeptidase MepM/ murein hydrolase activator NlpD
VPEDDLSKQKNIVGLSFRDLKGEDSSEDFVFVNEEIGGDNTWEKFVKWLNEFFDPDTDRKGVVPFFSNFFTYVFSRLRVIFVLLSVLVDIVFSTFEKAKDALVRKSFWGRGGFLIYAAQTVLGVIIVIVVVSSVYRNPAITSANEENLDYVGVVEDDLLTMNASLNTLIPEDRKRFGVETYIVKGGDTVSKIADYYGISSDTLLWANDMDEGDYIKPGDELNVPNMEGVLVTVKSGDTLSSLAKKYNGNSQAILDINWLDSTDSLEVGQEIFIPDGTPPKPVTVVATSPSYTYRSSSYNYTSIPVDSSVGRFLSWPVAGGRGTVTQCYFSYHMGIDIADRSMPSLVAAAGGQVIYAGWNSSGYGYSVQILHSNGYSTWYAHMNRIYVKSGQYVSKGQSIGQMGSTGRSTGPHVHFELRRGTAWGTNVSPVPYMDRSMGYCW